MNRTSTRLQAAAIVAATFIAGIFTAPTVAGTMQADQYDYMHRQMGATTPEARSVGLITAGADSGGLIYGSGVLVGGRFVLTAAHLIDDAGTAQFTINGQSYGARRWVVANRFYSRGDDDDPNPDSRNFASGADLALIELDRRVTGAQNLKATINKNRKEAGKTATIVGYGTGGNGTTGIRTATFSDQSTLDPAGEAWQYQPVKRAGMNVIETTGPFGGSYKTNRELRTDFDPDPSQLSNLLALTPPQVDLFSGEWDIDEDDIPVSGEYMPSIGDSGGGLFINGRLAGITSWTSRQNSEYFSTASYTRLSVGWWKWVRDNIRAYNRLRDDPTLTPWIRADNPKGKGAGFRGVARIQAEADDEDAGIVEGQILDIFGPRLFYDENAAHFDVTSDGLSSMFVSGDLAANPGPLSYETGLPYPTPEPTSLALLGLGGLAMLRRSRR